MVTSAAPDRGDIISVQLNPQMGREQAGRRPALVLSSRPYNAKVGLAIVCPITQQIKGFSFEVPVPSTLKTKGVVLSDHIKSIDWKARGARILEKAPKSLLENVMERVDALLS